MRIKKAITIRELSDEVTGRHEDDDRLVVHHTLVLEVRLPGQEPVRVSVVYVETVRDGQECPECVTRVNRSRVPRQVRALARQIVLEHLGKRFQVSPRAWPPEPILFKPRDVILSIRGDAWKFTSAGAIQFLQACIHHESTGMDRDRPSASDHGGVLIEGAQPPAFPRLCQVRGTHVGAIICTSWRWCPSAWYTLGGTMTYCSGTIVTMTKDAGQGFVSITDAPRPVLDLGQFVRPLLVQPDQFPQARQVCLDGTRPVNPPLRCRR